MSVAWWLYKRYYNIDKNYFGDKDCNKLHSRLVKFWLTGKLLKI